VPLCQSEQGALLGRGECRELLEAALLLVEEVFDLLDLPMD
jgi:hypothetical protein